MHARQQEIVRILLTEPDRYILVEEFAERLACSEKTIRNDLKEIESYLQGQGAGKLIKKPGLGIYLDVAAEESARLFNQLAKQGHAGTTYTDDQRRMNIAYQLLINAKPVTARTLASHNFVNLTAIRKDIEKIKQWLKEREIRLTSRQKVGLVVEGTEKSIRSALSELTQLTSRPDSVAQFIQAQFDPSEVSIVNQELRRLQKQQRLYFTDEAFERLLIHVLIMIRRVKVQQTISVPNQEKEAMRAKVEYDWAAALLTRIGEVLAVRFPEEEVSYLTRYILGAKFNYHYLDSGQHKKLSDKPMLEQLISLLIKRMSELTMIDFSQDGNLKEGLYLHLYSALNRLNYHLPVKNPMLHEIKKMYPYMFDMIIYSLEEVEKSHHLVIPEEEAAYLTLHFQASIERLNNNQDRKKRAVIVCHMGIGMSQLLRTKLEGKFPGIDLTESIAKADLKAYLASNEVDFIVSTVPLEKINVPFTVISPLLTEQELTNLSAFINQLDKPEADKTPSIIASLTTPSIITMNESYDHYYQVIEQLADRLSEQGFVDRRYAHSALKRERASATYIGSEVAIPHGDPALIHKPAIASAVFKEPIKWGDDWVSLVFLLAVPSHNQQLTKQLFQRLSDLTAQPQLVQQLAKTTDKAAFISLL